MRVLGIDWATDPKNRAACWLRRQNAARWIVEELHDGVSDDEVVSLITSAQSVVGVDIPFGWPREFAALVAVWTPHDGGEVPEADPYRFRLTDRVVRDEGAKQPLSVSSDLISLATRVWCTFVRNNGWHDWIDTTGEADDAARKRLIETYPAASLCAFLGEYPTGYKKSKERRAEIAATLFEMFPLQIEDETALQGRNDKNGDHILDAFLCALTAGIAAGWSKEWDVRKPTKQERDLARHEGWMFFPVKRD